MTIGQSCIEFIKSPFPLWENKLTRKLVENKWNELNTIGIKQNNYSISCCLNPRTTFLSETFPVFGELFIEVSPDLDYFYEQNGLIPEKLDYSNSQLFKDSILRATELLKSVDEIEKCLKMLIKTVQVLHCDDQEVDISYSHPDIPFSVFVSISKVDSPEYDLRLAESILHEMMHLKLTLIEQHIPLFVYGQHSHFSPWRLCERPIKGVLHGLFVFSAIKQFYQQISKGVLSHEALLYTKRRIEDINTEIKLIFDLPLNRGLSAIGKEFALKLISN